MVESKLRQVVMRLEVIDSLELAHPYIKSFDKKYFCYSDEERNDCIHGKFPQETTTTSSDEPDPERVKEEGVVVSTVYTTSFYIGLKTKKDPNSATAKQSLDISWPVSQFTDMVHKWDLYDATSMGMTVNLIKR